MIISISGKMRSGKDEIFKILAEYGGFKRVALADPLKEICSKVFDIPLNFFYDDALKDSIFANPINFSCNYHLKLEEAIQAPLPILDMQFTSPRDMMQKVGTELVRAHVSDTFWLDMLIDQLRATEGNVVITDARFQNERDALANAGATLLLVTRKATDNANGHVSENNLGNEDDYDVVVRNDGTLSELHHDVKQWYRLRFGQ